MKTGCVYCEVGVGFLSMSGIQVPDSTGEKKIINPIRYGFHRQRIYRCILQALRDTTMSKFTEHGGVVLQQRAS